MNKDFLEILFARYAKFYSHMDLDLIKLTIICDIFKAELFSVQVDQWLDEIINYHKENQ